MNGLVAISGGIGSGKSMVCSILRAMGYRVYDCDARAKCIMNSSDAIKQKIARDVCVEAIVDNEIDRAILACKVFADQEALTRLNSIVHDAVKRDLALWHNPNQLEFVETAILYQSGIDAMVCAVWDVTAPKDLRIDRVMHRSGLSMDAVQQRIMAQDSYMPIRLHRNTYTIVNDSANALLPQVESLLRNQY